LDEEVGHGGGGSGRVASATQDSLTKVVLHGSEGERFPPGLTRPEGRQDLLGDLELGSSMDLSGGPFELVEDVVPTRVLGEPLGELLEELLSTLVVREEGVEEAGANFGFGGVFHESTTVSGREVFPTLRELLRLLVDVGFKVLSCFDVGRVELVELGILDGLDEGIRKEPNVVQTFHVDLVLQVFE
jgi:hypothetical protein